MIPIKSLKKEKKLSYSKILETVRQLNDDEKQEKQSEILENLIASDYSITDMMKFISKKRNKAFISLLISSWFSEVFLKYLTIDEIGKLDLTISCREKRTEWLKCIRNSKLSVTLRKTGSFDETLN